MSEAVCRACLSGGVGLRAVRDTQLLLVYEKLANAELRADDGRPEAVCYVCYWQLQKCRRFSEMAHRSERFLRELLQNNMLVTRSTVAKLHVGATHRFSITTPHSISFNEYSENSSSKQEDERVEIKVERINEEFPKSENCFDPNESFKQNIFTNLINADSDLFCETCQTMFKSKRELMAHVSSHAADSEPQDAPQAQKANAPTDPNSRETHCRECDKTFSNWKSLKIHSSIHTGAKPFICHVCEKPFRLKQSLQNHVTVNHTREKTFACHLCSKSFFLKKRLAAHNKFRHPSAFAGETPASGEKPFACHPCSKSFRSKQSLQNHNVVHHEREKLFNCDICHKSFFHKRNLATHRKARHPEDSAPASARAGDAFSCGRCDRTFPLKRHLTQHARRAHDDHKPHCCDRCSKKFKELNQLKTHLRCHTGEQPYRCDTCGRRFSQRGNLLLHLKIHRGEKTFACEVCGKTFLLKCQLRSHQRLHSGERPHACARCDMTFAYKSAWKEHVRRRHAEVKPYPCTRCGKSFDRECGLTRHARVHTAERSFACRVCSKSYTTAESLRRHLGTHSDAAPHACDRCRKGFKLLQYLNQHRLSSARCRAAGLAAPSAAEPFHNE